MGDRNERFQLGIGLRFSLVLAVALCFPSLALPREVGGKIVEGSGPRTQQGASRDPTINLDVGGAQQVRRLPEGFLGANILYWIDTDEVWAGGRLPKLLREAGVRSLRFPGGVGGTNYDWEMHRLERGDAFPFEAKTDAERQRRLDFKEFLSEAKALDIKDIFFVVNLSGAFFAQGDREANLRRYAEKAARWVKAVKDSGYHVPYWEIGNEAYLKSAMPIEAHEYAAALKIYSSKMKAADPSIKIGAVGPELASGRKAVGFGDTLGKDGMGRLRGNLKAGEDPCRRPASEGAKGVRIRGKECLDAVGMKRNAHRGHETWWDQLLREAPEAFDFVVIHRYGWGPIGRRGTEHRLTELAKNVSQLKALVEQRRGTPVQLALTEWNTPSASTSGVSEADHLLDISTQLTTYLNAGVDFAEYWPLRLQGSDRYPMLGTDLKARPPFSLLKVYSETLRGTLVDAKPRGIAQQTVIASRSGNTYGVVLTNYAATPALVRLTLPPGNLSCKGNAIVVTGAGVVTNTALPNAKTREACGNFMAPARSIVGFSLHH